MVRSTAPQTCVVLLTAPCSAACSQIDLCRWHFSALPLQMADWQRDLQRYPAGELAGRLQKQLATQMGRSAHSVIVIQGVHIAPLPLLGVLINALAEGGHFEQGGKQIATSDALFVATMWASPGTVSQVSWCAACSGNGMQACMLV